MHASAGVLVLVLLLCSFAGVAYAAFVDKGQVLGSTFSVGSADLKLLRDLSLGADGANLADEIQGPSFSNISSNWTADYLVKLYNNGSSRVTVTTNSDYLTANDPDELRQLIYVEIIEWNDANSDGTADETELGVSYGRDTIVKWKTQGFSLGSIDAGAVKGLVVRFSTGTVSDTKQGAVGIFDFEFNSIGE